MKMMEIDVIFENQRIFYRKQSIALQLIPDSGPKENPKVWNSKFLMVQNFWINLSFDLNPNTVYQRDTIMEAHSCREGSAQIWL